MAKPFNGRFQLQVNYTYATGTDNLANPNLGLGVAAQGGGAVPTDNLNLEFDRGNSDLLVPHALVASGVLAIPGGLSLSGVFRGTSGTFFSAAGGLRDYDGDGISSSRPESTSRNQFRGPAAFNTDVPLEKRFTFGGYAVSGLIEVFNLFNARNPRLIHNTFAGNAPTATLGRSAFRFRPRDPARVQILVLNPSRCGTLPPALTADGSAAPRLRVRARRAFWRRARAA